MSELYIALVGLALHALTLTGAGIWKITQMRDAIIVKIDADKKEIFGMIDTERRIISEIVLALRQKINDVELNAFKTFVRHDNFLEVLKQLQEAADTRFDKIEVKLDRIIEGRLGLKPDL